MSMLELPARVFADASLLSDPATTIHYPTRSLFHRGKMISPIRIEPMTMDGGSSGDALSALGGPLNMVNLGVNVIGHAVTWWQLYKTRQEINAMHADLTAQLSRGFGRVHSHLDSVHLSLLQRMDGMERRLMEQGRVVIKQLARISQDMARYAEAMQSGFDSLRRTLEQAQISQLDGTLQAVCHAAQMDRPDLTRDILTSAIIPTNTMVSLLQKRAERVLPDAYAGLSEYAEVHAKASDLVVFARAVGLRADIYAALGQFKVAAQTLASDLLAFEKEAAAIARVELNPSVAFLHPAFSSAISHRRVYNVHKAFVAPTLSFEDFLQSAHRDSAAYLPPRSALAAQAKKFSQDFGGSSSADGVVARWRGIRDATDFYQVDRNPTLALLVASDAIGWLEKLAAIRLALGARVHLFRSLATAPTGAETRYKQLTEDNVPGSLFLELDGDSGQAAI